MDFPAYVPAAVRQHISVALGIDCAGAAPLPDGDLLQLLSRSKSILFQWDYFLDHVNQTDLGDSFMDAMRVNRAETKENCDFLAKDVACLRRLANDWRMQSVYACLVGTMSSEAKMVGFIYAAWTANINYAKYRKQVKDATEHASRVAIAAGALAALLRKSDQFSCYLPDSFFSVVALLEKTEHWYGDQEFHVWPIKRSLLLGQPLGDAPMFGPGADVEPQKIHNAWNSAPGLARIIETLQREALASEPAESGNIGAALASRKKHPSMEYLRAFVEVLRTEHQIEPAGLLLGAMATTANVVLNESDLALSANDVRSAISRQRP